MHNILFISGTRPEIIKLAPVYHALRDTGWADTQWLHTSQHADMATSMHACFDVKPDITLSRAGASLLDFSTGCRQQLDAVMTQRPWSLAVVQGDTESTFLGALAAFYHRIPVAHVEAGLRTYNLDRPFPEEGLRQMVSRLARFHFPPTSARPHGAAVRGHCRRTHPCDGQHRDRRAGMDPRAPWRGAPRDRARAPAGDVSPP
jgi:UDP-N-acetylglucosamine 2-epimerase (non-hydrolysing)